MDIRHTFSVRARGWYPIDATVIQRPSSTAGTLVDAYPFASLQLDTQKMQRCDGRATRNPTKGRSSWMSALAIAAYLGDLSFINLRGTAIPPMLSIGRTLWQDEYASDQISKLLDFH